MMLHLFVVEDLVSIRNTSDCRSKMGCKQHFVLTSNWLPCSKVQENKSSQRTNQRVRKSPAVLRYLRAAWNHSCNGERCSTLICVTQHLKVSLNPKAINEVFEGEYLTNEW